jgi:germination protein YpeB
MNFSNKLKDWKERLTDRHMFSIVVTSFLVILALLGYIIKIRNDNKQALENTYNHAFFELASYIDNINNLLSKAQISKDPSHGAKTMSEIWRQSNLAKTNLVQLPIEQDTIAQASKFLSQASDFSYSLTMQTIDQIPVSDEQLNNIKSLSDYAEKLQKSISALSNELNSGKLYWNEIAKKGTATFKQVSNESEDNSFTEISKNFQDYPGLIYDGPFSEHITDIKPVGITGKEIDSNKAIEIAKKFVEKNIKT